MAEPVVLLDCPAPYVGRLRINRPDKRNAIDHEVRELLTQHLQALLRDNETRALVFGGVGGVFSAGGDLPSMVGLNEEQVRDRMRHVHVLCRLLADAQIPVVSAMEGIAAGAAVGLALLGDEIVAGPGTKILFPFLKLGLTPDWGQLLTLRQRIGLVAARRMLTSGSTVPGEEARQIGLVDTFVADAEVMATAVARASELAKLPIEAFGRMKARLNDMSSSLREELVREEDDQVACLTGEDFAEGYDAFRNERVVDFVARPGARKA